MKQFHDQLREAGLLRPAREHETQPGWTDIQPDMHWMRGNPAFTPKTTVARQRAVKPAPPPIPCKMCQVAAATKAGCCGDCYIQVRRARQKADRERRRLERGEPPAQPKPKAIRTHCKNCGQPVVKAKTQCTKCYSAYQKAQADKRKAELDMINAEHRERRIALLEKVQNARNKGV